MSLELKTHDEISCLSCCCKRKRKHINWMSHIYPPSFFLLQFDKCHCYEHLVLLPGDNIKRRRHIRPLKSCTCFPNTKTPCHVWIMSVLYLTFSYCIIFMGSILCILKDYLFWVSYVDLILLVWLWDIIELLVQGWSITDVKH